MQLILICMHALIHISEGGVLLSLVRAHNLWNWESKHLIGRFEGTFLSVTLHSYDGFSRNLSTLFGSGLTCTREDTAEGRGFPSFIKRQIWKLLFTLYTSPRNDKNYFLSTITEWHSVNVSPSKYNITAKTGDQFKECSIHHVFNLMLNQRNLSMHWFCLNELNDYFCLKSGFLLSILPGSCFY